MRFASLATPGHVSVLLDATGWVSCGDAPAILTSLSLLISLSETLVGDANRVRLVSSGSDFSFRQVVLVAHKIENLLGLQFRLS